MRAVTWCLSLSITKFGLAGHAGVLLWNGPTYSYMCNSKQKQDLSRQTDVSKCRVRRLSFSLYSSGPFSLFAHNPNQADIHVGSGIFIIVFFSYIRLFIYYWMMHREIETSKSPSGTKISVTWWQVFVIAWHLFHPVVVLKRCSVMSAINFA